MAMIEIFSFILSLLCIFISSKRGNDFQDFHFSPRNCWLLVL